MASWSDTRERNLKAAAERREAERADALHYLVDGDEEHAPHCVHALAGGQPCSREYDPKPYREAAPEDLRMYDGTGIGALYGQSTFVPFSGVDENGEPWTGARSLLADLAGWNVVPGCGRP